MPRKNSANIKHLEKAHPVSTAEESRSRVLERQRYRRARWNVGASIAFRSRGLSDPGDPAVLAAQGELDSEDGLSTISTDVLPQAPDVWDLATLHRGLEDATGAGQATLPPINSKADFYFREDGSGDNGDGFYAGEGGLGDDGDDVYAVQGLDDHANSIGGSLNGPDAPFSVVAIGKMGEMP
ncbi:hypothetical protein ACLOAV_004618 [Pseudogymnoascus australis]